MKFDPQIRHRRSIRLQGYDYTQAGGYFVTIITSRQECLFGEIRNGEMIFNDAGRAVNAAWEALLSRFTNIDLDVFQLMPNHFHGIIIIHADPVGAGTRPAQLSKATAPSSRATTRVAPTLGDMIGAFKSITTHEYIRGVKQSGWTPFEGKLWQRNYYEHILRCQADWERIADYIAANPSNWSKDHENPANVQ